MAEKHHRDGGSNLEYHTNSSDMLPGNFPEGMRVLVFDKDQDYLLELEQYLKGFQYAVTCCNDEERAMYILRHDWNQFDLALIELQKTDGDRLRLLSEITSEMDLPIIIMSKDESIESVINWMSHGACDYLIKPLRLEDLRFIFKQVAKINGKVNVVAGEVEEKTAGGWSSSVASTIKDPNKSDLDRDHASKPKKRRVVWTAELHQKFIEAVNFLGPYKAVPKKILEYMNVKNLSRENVASHLQKYRLSLAKKQPKKKEMSPSLLTPQERILFGEEVPNFYEVRNVVLPTHHINNIPQPSAQQQIMNPNNVQTHFMSRLGHHHDGVSIAVSDRNRVMNHRHQVSEFNAGESLGYNNFIDYGPKDLASYLFTQNSEDVSLVHSVLTPTTIPNDHHLSASLDLMNNIHQTTPSSIFPSSYGSNSFLDQQENGVFNYNRGY